MSKNTNELKTRDATHRRGLASLGLFFYGDCDGFAEAGLVQGPVLAVSELERERVLTGSKLHFDDRRTVPEVNPRVGLGNELANGKAFCIDTDVMVSGASSSTVAKRTSPAGDCPPRCWNRPSWHLIRRMCPEVHGKRTAPSTPSSGYQIRRQPPRV